MQIKPGSLKKSQENIYQKFINASISPELAKIAASNTGQNLYLVALSGKMGSGKDTIGYKIMNQLANTNWVQLSFASAIKKDIDDIIKICQKANSKEEAIEEVIKEGFPDNCAEEAVSILYQESKESTINAYHRSPTIRKALQYWGKAVRDEKGALYWSNILLSQIATALANRTSILVSDARFDHEIDLCKEVGFITIRLDIDDQTQEKRLLDRDGVKTPKTLLEDISEIALDEYKHFDIRINTANTQVVEKVVDIIKGRG